MKKFYLFILIMVIGCQEKDIPITISDTPEISFKEIEFIERATEFNPDTLRLTLLFQDGDANLGLRNDGDDILPPYHYRDFFYIENGALNITASSERDDLLKLGDIDSLPPYEFPYNCINYTIINRANDPYNNTINNDTLYVQPNLYYHNILVKYFVKKNGVYDELDFSVLFEPQCNDVDYNGRFPRIALPTDQANYPITISDALFKITQTSPYSGELEYSMRSGAFLLFFRDDTLKLKVKILDRSLNSSNWIETPPFTF